MKNNKGMIVAFLLPAVSIFALIFVYPIVRTLAMSFFSIESVIAPATEWHFVGFDNFIRLFQTSLFITSMTNLFKIWSFGGLAVLLISLLFAVILTSGIRFKRFFRAVIYMPNIVSAVALATMWMQYVYSPRYGLFKGFFESIGLDEVAAFPWLSVENKFLALLVAYCFGMVGYHMLIWMSGIERISPEYYEAATIDGADKIKQFRYVTFPLLKGIIKTNITMWTVTTSGFFIWSQLFSTVTAGESTIVPVQYMYAQIFGTTTAMAERDAGYAAAIGVLLSLCVVIIFKITGKLLPKDDFEF